MTGKARKLFEWVWLLALLEEAQISMDECRDTPMFRQDLKNALNRFEAILDKTFSSPQMLHYYLKQNGAESTEGIRTQINIIKQEFIKLLESDA